ncbi:ATP synthase F1 subunit gamma [Mycoplasma sp. CB776]
MASNQKIKTRINLISNTRKITKAMELLSSAKLRRMKNNFLSIQEYSNSIKSILSSLAQKTKNISEIFTLNKEAPKLFIIITSDLGLCGGYNSNIYKLTKKEIGKNDKLIIFGNKGISLFKDFETQVIQKHSNYGDDLNYSLVNNVINKIKELLESKSVSEVNLVYTKFINSVLYEPLIKKLLPLNNNQKSDFNISDNENNVLVEFEPNPEIILKNLIPLYMGSTIYNALAESKISEMSSRRTAMENASNNADEIINNLQIVFNRARQSSITQEITEIIGGTTTK